MRRNSLDTFPSRPLSYLSQQVSPPTRHSVSGEGPRWIRPLEAMAKAKRPGDAAEFLTFMEAQACGVSI